MKELNITIDKNSFPVSIKGFIVKDDDTTYRIFINDTLDSDDQAAAFLHECLHIWNDDFNSNDSADHIEQRTHKQLKRISEIFKM